MESRVCWKDGYMFQNKYKPCKLKPMYTVSQSNDQQLGKWVVNVYSVPPSELVAVGGVQSWAASEPCCLCPHTVQSCSGCTLGAWRNGCPPPTTPEHTQSKVSHQSGWYLWLQKTHPCMPSGKHLIHTLNFSYVPTKSSWAPTKLFIPTLGFYLHNSAVGAVGQLGATLCYWGRQLQTILIMQVEELCFKLSNQKLDWGGGDRRGKRKMYLCLEHSFPCPLPQQVSSLRTPP